MHRYPFPVSSPDYLLMWPGGKGYTHYHFHRPGDGPVIQPPDKWQGSLNIETRLYRRLFYKPTI